MRRLAGALAALSVAVSGALALPRTDPPPAHTRALTFTYRAYTGKDVQAVLLLPSEYGPEKHKPIPLVISPHGRGLWGRSNARLWGDLPGLGGFAVVNPDGNRFSWGDPRAIADLAEMPRLLHEKFPWLEIERRRIYSIGGSMGGQETLMLLARYPRLLAGAISVDGVSDFARQYRNYPQLNAGCDAQCRQSWGGPVGTIVQEIARREMGTPESNPKAYRERSAIYYTDAIADSCVPLQIWWSRTDKIVRDSNIQSGRLLERLRKSNPTAPIEGYTGDWPHTKILNAKLLLPNMLADFGLLPRHDAGPLPGGITRIAAPGGRCNPKL